jgi:hypothetical protein
MRGRRLDLLRAPDRAGRAADRVRRATNVERARLGNRQRLFGHFQHARMPRGPGVDPRAWLNKINCSRAPIYAKY